MGKVTDSLLSGAVGKVGNLVLYKQKGKTFIKQKATRSADYKPSKLQLYSNNAFVEVQQFLLPIESILAMGFERFTSGGKRGIHLAMSWALKHAVENEDGIPRLYPKKIKVCDGDLDLSPGMNLVKEEERKYSIYWDVGEVGRARHSDICWVLIYNPLSKKFRLIDEGVYRKRGFLAFTLDPNLDLVGGYVYVAFYRLKKNKARYFSSSVCLGSLE
ncbi:DUF6266 family protein [Algoriphagus winogradskyi]|uniref:Uncharacterized protein n=1 Tax=Algoriphagus winogradskyi TaxID=237017 RepID=A0ABY1NVI2_9BACT|nr:DUF6266 family protein [Algoriphagus winogradskyi]SMP19350.1 hypothetical protein SAMN06265367_1031 [Algoriphagus winogradskyi]